MRTCRIARYLHRHLPADIAGISENVDIIPVVTTLDCLQLPGLEHLGVLEFSPNLTIIQGRSGVGASRILEAMKSKADGNVELPALPKMDLSRSSPGETLFRIIHSLLEILPDDRCLLLDNMECLSGDRLEKLLVFIAGREAQVVMSAKPHQIDASLRTCIHLSYRLVEDTDNEEPSLMQCWV